MANALKKTVIPRNATRLVVDSAALDWCEFV